MKKNKTKQNKKKKENQQKNKSIKYIVTKMYSLALKQLKFSKIFTF